MIGKMLGHFKIVGKLGQGGMGEVWLAEDPRLQRQVAVKILPGTLAADAERRSRFEREARAVAALTHPNIVTIHAIEETNGILFIAMERVHGRPLSEVIGGRSMAPAQLLDVASQIADAVAAAHVAGITHRDLKPDNVMVGDDGRVKVLDFGLAKVREEGNGPHGTQLPTVTPQTRAGVVLGTVAYMSPEQAEGKPADARSDVFSLGVILHEMATGERPFAGDSQASLIASILRDTPPSVVERNRALPRHLGRIIRICLAKDPLRRYQSAVDLRNELDELRREVHSGEILLDEAPAGAASGRLRRRALRAWLPLAAIAGATAAATMALTLMLAPRNSSRPGLPAAQFTQLTDEQGVEDWPSLSPDGNSLAYVKSASGSSDLFVQRVGGRNAIRLGEGSDDNEGAPAFSPDGQVIAYHVAQDPGGIFLVGATGESRRRLTDRGFHPAWSPDGRRIVFDSENFIVPMGRATNSRLATVEVASGAVTQLTDGSFDAIQACWSPNGARLAFWTVRSGSGQRDLMTMPASGGAPSLLTDDVALDFGPRWAPDGHVYFSSDRGGVTGIWRVKVDEKDGKPLSAPEPVTNGVAAADMYVTMSQDGRRLAYVSRVGQQNLAQASFDPNALTLGPLEMVTRGTRSLLAPELSPDGRSLTYVLATNEENLVVSRADGSDPRRLTDDPSKVRAPRWSPDGSRIAFYSDRSGSYEVWTIRPDGSGLTQLSDTPGRWLLFPVWSPGGDRMVASHYGEGGIVLFDPNRSWSEQTPEVLEGTGMTDSGFLVALSWSPNGHALAGNILGAGGGPGGVGIYDLRTRTMKRVVEEGASPTWLDGRRILFVRDGQLLVLEVESGRTREPSGSLPEGANFSSITRDHRTLYFSVTETESDIWMMEMPR